MANDTQIPAWLVHHLQHNHFPPVPLEAAPVLLEALEHCSREDYDVKVMTPSGVAVPASQLVEAFHLEEMVEVPTDESPFADEVSTPIEESILALRYELKARQELITQRLSRAEYKSSAWFQLEGQLLELDRMVFRLAELFA